MKVRAKTQKTKIQPAAEDSSSSLFCRAGRLYSTTVDDHSTTAPCRKQTLYESPKELALP